MRVGLGVAMLLFSSLAWAEGDDNVARAKIHFAAGREHMKNESYADAVREFEAGYQLAPKPAFLLNIGNAYRLMGEKAAAPASARDALERSRANFVRFLNEAPASDPQRDEVARLMAEVDQRLAAVSSPPPPPNENTNTNANATNANVNANVNADANANVTAVVHAAPPPPKSFLRRHWWIFPVGAVVLAGAAVGIYFAVRPTPLDCGAATIACIDTAR
jgi:hypothetical protein